MSFSIDELRSRSDDEIIDLHDRQAIHTQVGVDYYLDELRRRDQARAMEASHRLAKASFVLTIVNAVLAVAAVVIALLA